MACTNYLEVEKILIWNTTLPYKQEYRTSPVFSLMGSKWYLRFIYCDEDKDYHAISLHQMGGEKSLEKPFDVKSYMLHNTEHKDLEKNEKKVTVKSAVTWLWWSGKEKQRIFVEHNWLYDCPQVKFACKFYGHALSTFNLQIETDHLSPVVVKKSLPKTEDKSIQVSSGVPRDIEVQVSSEVPRDIDSLSSDFSHLLQEEILPDVRLECDGRTFQAHKPVLVARSEVFRAMFQNKMLEDKTGAVKVQDVDVGVLEKLLKFVYTGRPEDLCEDTTADLYEAADKYAVLSLKTACAYWIVRNLTVENCVKYLRVSDSHSDHDLKAAVISFITENPNVMKSEAWFALSKGLPLLANEVLQTYVNSAVQ